MERLLDIREVAEFLRVEYKTAYRLVTAGEIPAAKIGKSYRIKQSDLLAYFDDRMKATQEDLASKSDAVAGSDKAARNEASADQDGADASASAGVTPDADGVARDATDAAGVGDARGVANGPVLCAWCGTRILSKLSRTGECAVCGAVICENCSVVGGVDRCREHAEAEAELVVCGVCGKALAGRWAAAMACDEGGCGRPICQDCHLEQGATRCLEHTPTPAKVAAEVGRLRDKGQPAVSAQEARVLEATFLSRVENRLKSATRLFDPTLGDYVAANGIWIAVSRTGGHGPSAPAKRPEQTGPTGETLAAEVSLKGGHILKRGRRKQQPILTIAACSVSRPAVHAKRGYDAAPGSLAEVTEVLGVRVRHAESVGVLEIVALASPTGWSAEAVAHVAGPEGKKLFSHRLVAVCLIDTATGAIHANEHDDRLGPYLYTFTMESDEKLLERCVNAAEEQLLARNSFSLYDLLDLLPIEERIAELAFRKLGSIAKYMLDQIEGIGLVLSHSPDNDT